MEWDNGPPSAVAFGEERLLVQKRVARGTGLAAKLREERRQAGRVEAAIAVADDY